MVLVGAKVKNYDDLRRLYGTVWYGILHTGKFLPAIGKYSYCHKELLFSVWLTDSDRIYITCVYAYAQYVIAI
jgi:hypothetical protein